ncbi:ABC transporter ATP-binding protein [Alicyclobacillus shizuokensis]|uniref:ABC transporter ATP-binding protein n=1 Tax=Alicyclobacillus shizuokensis TaxID=392014 RepID=UPI000829D886|nr:ABC transporter ATP-binding protein [Alicyclobacillus shizuokensis]
MSEMVIETSNLTRRYGKKVSVNNVNLKVPKGSIYGFLGPNGAGKTTTIRMLLGLIRPTSGHIRIFNQDLSKHRMPILRRIGSLVESPSYYGHLSGYENLDVIARLLKVPSKRIDEVLGIVRLTPAAHQTVKGYSLGMKQRLGIAAALLGNPDLLILDEPTNGLDPAGIHEIRTLIKDMPKQHGITVVVSSHLLSEIDQMATHVGIIDHGHLLFQDSIEKLREQSSPKLFLQVDKPHEAKRLLQDAGFKVSIQGDNLQIPNSDLSVTEEINRQLVQAGISVYRISEQSRSLEDIFLDFVDKEGSL